MLEDFELRECAVINDFGVHEDGAGQFLKGHEVIVAADCVTNCSTAMRKCLPNVLA